MNEHERCKHVVAKVWQPGKGCAGSGVRSASCWFAGSFTRPPEGTRLRLLWECLAARSYPYINTQPQRPIAGQAAYELVDRAWGCITALTAGTSAHTRPVAHTQRARPPAARPLHTPPTPKPPKPIRNYAQRLDALQHSNETKPLPPPIPPLVPTGHGQTTASPSQKPELATSTSAP